MRDSMGEYRGKRVDNGEWVDAKGHRVKDWKRKIAGVWFTDEKLIPPKSALPDVMGPVKKFDI